MKSENYQHGFLSSHSLNVYREQKSTELPGKTVDKVQKACEWSSG